MPNVTLFGSQASGHPTSEVSSREGGSTQVYKHTLGARATDSAGNEFVYVEFGAVIYSGAVVGITRDYTSCAVLTNTFRGPIGVVMGETTSDTAGWVQVYGTHSAVQVNASSNATSSAMLLGSSVVSTPATGMTATTLNTDSDSVDWIYGMWPSAAVETATTAATSVNGQLVAVVLHYPWVLGKEHHIGSSTV